LIPWFYQTDGLTGSNIQQALFCITEKFRDAQAVCVSCGKDFCVHLNEFHSLGPPVYLDKLIAAATPLKERDKIQQ
jgi:thymidine kinase